ncbi:MAG: adenylate/guanylate cyclase domain-containing protein [Deltaproteobacteria bacterium]|nr:adenylate/guanylate cyclase domain-containing protein [Candidatus Zymogenaceae bacterium]
MRIIEKKKTIPYRMLSGGIVGVCVFFLVLALYLFGLITTIERKTQDFRFRIASRPQAVDEDIVIITVDEESLQFYREDLGTWPWPREIFGALVEYLKRGNAQIIVFDMIFAEPDVMNPASDAAFARSLEGETPVLFSLVFRETDGESMAPSYEALMQGEILKDRFSLSVFNESPVSFGEYSSVTLPYLSILASASGVGSINYVADPDGPSRGVYPLFLYNGAYYPSLSLASALAACGYRPEDVEITLDNDRTLHAGGLEIPLLPDGRMSIKWHGPYGTYQYYRIGDIIESMLALSRDETPRIDPQTFSGKIVVVGTTAVSLFDLRAMPFSPVYPGVELNATAIDNIINNDFIRHTSRWCTILILFASSLLISLFSIRFASPGLSIAFFLICFGLLTSAVVYFFTFFDLMVEYVAPATTLFLSFTASMVFNYITEGRTKRKFKEAFAKYVSPHVADEISRNLGELNVDAGERTEISILFCDIRDFTVMSENLPPEEVVRILNRYFSFMVEVIFAHGGTLDKYMGDGIMAFFGAPKHDPNHARNACRAALAMQRELRRLNLVMEWEGVPPLSIGVGVNTGEAVVGNIGTDRRMEYTAIGDHVNLAARLEVLNKEFKTGVIISEFTLKKAGDVVVRDLGEVGIRGKREPVRIYELIDEHG